MDNLQQQIDNLKTLQESYDAVAQAAEAYNTGKVQLAQAITSKGVETSPTESYPEMAEKVNAISQETYEITGGELYGAQISGSLQTPNYWDLYAVLMQLLSDGRLVTYGGILLAEYYRGYDSIALSGAGAGGAYVVSDKDGNGNFIKYDTDIVHTWNTEFDGKGNRWVAYCFAEEYHNFDITDTNTSPRSIFIGRKVGTITSLANGRVSQIVVPDGNKLGSFNTGTFTQNWGRVVCVRNVEDPIALFYGDIQNTESVYIESNTISHNIFRGGKVIRVMSLVVKCDSFSVPSIVEGENKNVSFSNFIIDAYQIQSRLAGGGSKIPNLTEIHILNTEVCDFALNIVGLSDSEIKLKRIFISYGNENDKTKAVAIGGIAAIKIEDVELKSGWNKPLTLVRELYGSNYYMNLTEANMYSHILQRLKQDEPDCGDGVTITIGSTNLAKLTSEESQELLALLRGTYGYTFA